jgi:hypothetical protein
MSQEKVIVYSLDGEHFNEDKDIIHSSDNGYYTGIRKEVDKRDLVSNVAVADIIDGMAERLWEIVGDVAEDNISLSDDNYKKLDSIIREFMEQHLSLTCYEVEEVKYHPNVKGGE